MRNATRRSILTLPLAAAALVLLVGPNPAAAQSAGTSSSTSARASAATGSAQVGDSLEPSDTGASHPGASDEGIKVHGRWVLEVRDPDGTVVEHREFENSLLGSGGLALSEILGGTRSAGSWLVGFGNGTGFGAAQGPCSGSTSCHIIPNGSSFNFDFTDTPSTNLQVTVNSGTVVISGSDTVAGGDISWVGTGIGLCFASVAPSNCDTNEAATFTRKNLSSPVTATAGQVVSVTVTLSFS